MEDSVLENGKVILTENGEKKEYDVVVTFDCEQNGKTYVGFTDLSQNTKERDISFMCYDTNLFVGDLYPVKTDAEYKMIEEVMEGLKK